MEILSELDEALGSFLPSVPATARGLALASAAQMGGSSVGLPSWLALRRADFRWRCRLGSRGGKVKFLFFNVGRITSRERLDADITLGLRPVPAASEAVPPPGWETATVELPRALAWRGEGRLAFRFAAESEFVVGADDSDWDWVGAVGPKQIALARWPGKGPLLAGEDEPWPLEAFVSFAQALAQEEALGGGVTRPLAQLLEPPPDTDPPKLWHTVAGLIRILSTAPRHLAEPDLNAQAERLAPLPATWRVAQAQGRLGVLVDPGGSLALAEAPDTLLVPFDVEVTPDPGRSSARVLLGWPDLVLRGALREALVEAFAKDAPWKKVAKRSGVEAARWDAWLSEEGHCVFLRTDRREDDDEVLAVLTGDDRGRRVAALVHANSVTFSFDERSETVKARARDFEVLQTGPTLGAEMSWDIEEGGGKQLFCDVLHGFLRWYALLRPRHMEP